MATAAPLVSAQHGNNIQNITGSIVANQPSSSYITSLDFSRPAPRLNRAERRKQSHRARQVKR